MALTGLVQVPTMVPAAPPGFKQLFAGAPELPNYQLTATISLEDPETGQKRRIASTSQSVKLGNPLSIPVSFNTTGMKQNRYNYWLTVQDAYGNILFDNIIYPRAVWLMTAEGFTPKLPTAPTITAPTAAMFGTPTLNLPNSVNYGDTWSGSINIPTQWPAGLPTPPVLPSLPLTLLAQLETPTGQRINVASLAPAFQPGQAINMPVRFDTSQLSGPGNQKILLTAKDLQGNNLLPGGLAGLPLGFLSVLEALPGKLPTVPGAGVLSQFPSVTVSLSPRTANQGDTVTIPVAYTHIGVPQSRTIRASIGQNRGYFDEILWAEAQISVPLDAAPVTRTVNVPVFISNAISPGTYGIQGKVKDLPGINILSGKQTVSPAVWSVIQVLAKPAAPTIKASSIPSVRTTLNPTTVNKDYTLQIPVTVDHFGTGESVVLYAAIGNSGAFGFDEILSGQASMTLPDDSKQTGWTYPVPVRITSAIAGGKSYDVYVKVMNRSSGQGQVVSSPQMNVVTVAGAAPAAPTIKASDISMVRVQLQATSLPVGATLNVPFSYQHRGASEAVSVYAAVGNAGVFGFDEILTAQKSLTIPQDTSLASRPGSISIPITSKIAANKSYSVYVKIIRPAMMADIVSPIATNIVTVTGAAVPAKLTASSSVKKGSALSYSWSGFQPNASVSIYVQGGGGLSATSNSSGAGSGSFINNDPPGAYTLVAKDSYGHQATASFTVKA